jgi:hypothetical protein
MDYLPKGMTEAENEALMDEMEAEYHAAGIAKLGGGR